MLQELKNNNYRRYHVWCLVSFYPVVAASIITCSPGSPSGGTRRRYVWSSSPGGDTRAKLLSAIVGLLATVGDRFASAMRHRLFMLKAETAA